MDKKVTFLIAFVMTLTIICFYVYSDMAQDSSPPDQIGHVLENTYAPDKLADNNLAGGQDAICTFVEQAHMPQLNLPMVMFGYPYKIEKNHLITFLYTGQGIPAIAAYNYILPGDNSSYRLAASTPGKAYPKTNEDGVVLKFPRKLLFYKKIIFCRPYMALGLSIKLGPFYDIINIYS